MNKEISYTHDEERVLKKLLDKGKRPIKLSTIENRKAIKSLREKGFMICANGNGYWLTQSIDEYITYIERKEMSVKNRLGNYSQWKKVARQKEYQSILEVVWMEEYKGGE